MKRFIAVCIVITALGCGGDEREAPRGPDVAACEQLREHVIDVRVGGLHEDREAHRVALRRALGADFLAGCADKPLALFDCELRATDLDSLRTCVASR